MNKSWNSKKSSALRRAMLAAVTPKDIYDITKMQLFFALRGDTFAAREVLDRCVGKAASVTDMIALESASEFLIDRETVDVQARAMLESVPAFPTYLVAEESETVEGSETP